MTSVLDRYLVVGLVALLIAGMGVAVATAPAAAQTFDGSGSWYDDPDDSSSSDGWDSDDSSDSQSDDDEGDWFDDDEDGSDGGDDDDGQNPDDGDSDDGDSDDGDSDDGDSDDGGQAEPTVQSASAVVTDTTYFSGRVQEVQFTFTATEGETVTLAAGQSSTRVRASGSQQRTSIRTGGMFWGVRPPVDVSVSAGDRECNGSVDGEGRTTQLCEAQEPDPEPEANFELGTVGSNSPVTEGETLSFDVNVQNTGDAAGTQDVTLSVAGQSTTETVTLDAGESTDVSLTWQTQTGDAGDHQASASAGDDSASAMVTVTQQASPASFQIADVSTDGPVTAGDALAVEATVENAGGQTGTQDVTLSVGGQTTTESVTLGSGESATVTLTWQTAAGSAGDYLAEASTDGDSASASVTVSEQATPATFQVTDVATDGPVTAGETLTVDATVQNTGDQAGTQSVSVSVGDRSTSESVTLDAGESTTVSLSWTTAAGDAGSHQASVGTEDDSESTGVTVSEAATPATFAVSDVSANDPTAGETLTVDAMVENTGDEQGTQTVSLNVDGVGSDSQSVSLAGGQSQSVTLSVGTGGGDAGTATADVSTDDDSASTSVTISEAATPASFQVGDVSSNAAVTEGDTIDVTATITNTGDEQGTQTVSLSTGALGSDSTSLTLSGGASQSVTLSVGTSEGDAGDYTADVSTDDDSGSTDVTVDELVTEGTLAGTVTDGSGSAVSGATVSAGGSSTTTAADGSYSLTLEAGDYTVEASADGYQDDSQSVTVTAGQTTTADVSLSTTPDPATFEIGDVSANSPLAGEDIAVDATIQNTGDLEGTQTISLSIGSGATDQQEVTVPGGDSTTVTLTVPGMPNAGTFTAQVVSGDASATTPVTVSSSEGTVEGTVTDESGSAISGATVSAAGSSASTDASGEYSLDVQAGSHAVEASAEGYESASQTVSVEAGSTTTADLSLTEVQQNEPQQFSAYVQGNGGYLHVNTSSASSSPMRFTQCEDAEPTDQALSVAPGYLPTPECVTIEGTYDPADGSWTGTIDFPQMVSEVPPPAGGAGPGEVYVATQVQSDSVGGTLDPDTGEMTLETDASIDIGIYNVSSHGDEFDPDTLPQITADSCHVELTGLSASTEGSFDSGSSATGSASVQGQRLNDTDVGYLVGNGFDASGATDCGTIMGTQLSGLINPMLGVPADSQHGNEVAMDVEVQFEN